MVAVPSLPALVLMWAASQLPESPRWLVTRRRMDEAVATLHGLRTGHPQPAERDAWDGEVAREALELWRSVMVEQQLEAGEGDAGGSSTRSPAEAALEAEAVTATPNPLSGAQRPDAVLAAKTEAEAAAAEADAADMELLHTLLAQSERGGTREDVNQWRIRVAKDTGVGQTLLQMLRYLLCHRGRVGVGCSAGVTAVAATAHSVALRP
jgi:hypothetical protein